ncbi:hypothetical protein Bca52824_087077 [Brassica carinata]|uniref:Major facilitator superfamily (MFS) profile domain-containing protein n=1 Tax=Brassica carinata TaxID=52824 RepID=A0A8X7PCY6_BRACI|nr:hypothetical protein Bca52824_087077 [Brassica carinata]
MFRLRIDVFLISISGWLAASVITSLSISFKQVPSIAVPAFLDSVLSSTGVSPSTLFESLIKELPFRAENTINGDKKFTYDDCNHIASLVAGAERKSDGEALIDTQHEPSCLELILHPQNAPDEDTYSRDEVEDQDKIFEDFYNKIDVIYYPLNNSVARINITMEELIGYSSPVQSDLTNDLNLSVAEYSLFGSILTVGAMIGTAMSGRISDLIGRRGTMGFSEMFCSLGWLVICLSKVTICLDVGRFLVGYGMGILSFVAKVGRWEEFEIVLQRLRGESADISYESSEIKYTCRLSQISEDGIFDLFQEQYSKSLLVGVGLMVLQQFGGVNGIVFYASSIFVFAGVSSKIGMIAMVIVQIPMTTIGVILMDKSGRRPLLLVIPLIYIYTIQISAAGTFIGFSPL